MPKQSIQQDLCTPTEMNECSTRAFQVETHFGATIAKFASIQCDNWHQSDIRISVDQSEEATRDFLEIESIDSAHPVSAREKVDA